VWARSIAWALVGGYAALSATRIALAVRNWRGAAGHEATEPPEQNPGVITVLQPILSGDPALPRVLAENLANQPSARFIWLVDADDPEGLRITAELADGNPRVEVLHCPPCPPLTNPKVFKLALGEPHCTELVAVLDDDTVLPPGALDRARAALSDADLATGLPWYDSGAGPWNALVAGFVNGNALVTYFPLLGNHGLAVRVRTLREAAIALPRALRLPRAPLQRFAAMVAASDPLAAA
jgi:ceramide glucosyltransferase